MKKLVAVILCIATMLSLVACSKKDDMANIFPDDPYAENHEDIQASQEKNESSQAPSAEDIDPEKEPLYQTATNCLDEFLMYGQFTLFDGTVYELNSATEKLYLMFSELGDYRDSKEILSHFVLLDDMLTHEVWVEVDAQGQALPDAEERVYTYYYDADGNIVFDYRDIHYIYDADGNCIREDRYYRYYVEDKMFLELSDTFIYEYDEYGTVIREAWESYEANSYDTRLTVTYDDEGKLTSRSWGEEDKTDYYHYNEKGQLVKIKLWVGQTHSYEYDEDGNVIRDGLDRYIYENGRMIQRMRNNSMGTCVYGTAYVLNTDGLMGRNDS